jgi:hypothetical protein
MQPRETTLAFLARAVLIRRAVSTNSRPGKSCSKFHARHAHTHTHTRTGIKSHKFGVASIGEFQHMITDFQYWVRPLTYKGNRGKVKA